MTQCWYLNWNSRCAVCFKKPEKQFKLIKHHISYYPEYVAYVHFECHQLIHEPESPLNMFVQYTASDSKRYYKEKNDSFKRNAKNGDDEN